MRPAPPAATIARPGISSSSRPQPPPLPRPPPAPAPVIVAAASIEAEQHADSDSDDEEYEHLWRSTEALAPVPPAFPGDGVVESESCDECGRVGGCDAESELLFCGECCMRYCAACDAAYHSSLPDARQHFRQSMRAPLPPPPTLPPPSAALSAQHPHEEAKEQLIAGSQPPYPRSSAHIVPSASNKAAAAVPQVPRPHSARPSKGASSGRAGRLAASVLHHALPQSASASVLPASLIEAAQLAIQRPSRPSRPQSALERQSWSRPTSARPASAARSRPSSAVPAAHTASAPVSARSRPTSASSHAAAPVAALSARTKAATIANVAARPDPAAASTALVRRPASARPACSSATPRLPSSSAVTATLASGGASARGGVVSTHEWGRACTPRAVLQLHGRVQALRTDVTQLQDELREAKLGVQRRERALERIRRAQHQLQNLHSSSLSAESVLFHIRRPQMCASSHVDDPRGRSPSPSPSPRSASRAAASSGARSARKQPRGGHSSHSAVFGSSGGGATRLELEAVAHGASLQLELDHPLGDDDALVALHLSACVDEGQVNEAREQAQRLRADIATIREQIRAIQQQLAQRREAQDQCDSMRASLARLRSEAESARHAAQLSQFARDSMQRDLDDTCHRLERALLERRDAAIASLRATQQLLHDNTQLDAQYAALQAQLDGMEQLRCTQQVAASSSVMLQV